MNKGATAKKEAPQYGEADRQMADRNISEMTRPPSVPSRRMSR
jgi:hypothetical protein